MKQRFDIVIAGAGMIGMTIASLLRRGQYGDRVNLVLVDGGERPSFSRDDDVALRVSAVSAGSAAILDDIGVWRAIAETRACGYEEMRVWDERGSLEGPETLRFSAAEFALADLGYIVENLLIRDRLLALLAASGDEPRFDTLISSLETSADGYRVHLSSGEELDADLVIGADGTSSRVREAAGIVVSAWQYAQCAFVTHVRPERPHRKTAYQRFLQTGPLGMLPLDDGRMSVVWSTTPEIAQDALQAGDPDLGAMLSKASDEILGMLQVAGPRGTFPLRAQYATRYVLPRLALLGDAAHGVHPLAGQGANLGFADAAALAGVIDAAIGNGEHPGDLRVLRRYERARKRDNQAMLFFIDGLNRLFSNDSEMVSRIRGAGMRLFNKSGPIRRVVVNAALGVD